MSVRTNLDLYMPRPKWFRYLLGYFALFLGSLLTKIKVEGQQNIPKSGPYIVAINHFSYIDPPFVVYALKRPITFLAASDHVIPWYVRWATYLYGFIPTNRKRLAPSTIKKAKQVLESNNILGIFPEGTSTARVLRQAKRGIVYLSTINNTTILPVSIYGLKNVWSNWFKGIRPKVKIIIGKSFIPVLKDDKHLKRDQRMDTIGDMVMCRIAALLPDNTHGIFKNDDRITQYREENQ